MARTLTNMKRPTLPAAASRPATTPAGPAAPPGPVPAGTILTEKYTDGESRTLQAIGWKQGDPIPPDLAKEIARVTKEAGTLPPGLEGFTGPRIARQMNIEDQPPEKLEELRSFLAEYKESRQKAPRSSPNPLENAPASVQRAQREGHRILREQQQQAAPPEEDEEGVTVYTGRDPEAAEATREAADLARELGETTGELKRCPRCDHDLAAPIKREPTATERREFLIAILGGNRFTKEYRLMGGQLVVRFRSLTARESDMAFRQVAADGWTDSRLQDGDPKALALADSYYRNLMSYRMALSLESISTPKGGPLEVGTIDRYEPPVRPEAPHTPLRYYYPDILEEVLVSDHLRRVVGRVFLDFEDLVATLESRAEDADFYGATG